MESKKYDTWRDVSRVHTINSPKDQHGQKLSFWSQPNRKREREREKAIFSLRFKGFRQSDLIRSKIKADLRDKGYVWVPESQDSAKVQGLGFHGN